jgi:lipopolysaccharide transport system permease protein
MKCDGSENEEINPSSSLLALFKSLWSHRQLISRIALRDTSARYKGSLFGLGWTFINPLMMLAVYTFVFSSVFKARWGIYPNESKLDFALILFVGLIISSLFSEVINRAPGLILNNINYVKKVVFPLEILPITTLGTALFHAAVSFLVVILAFGIINGYVHLTALLAPIILLPFLLIILGLAWAIASLGVYIRDIGQVVTLLTTLMIFMAPVFYPLSAIPEKFRAWIMLNPLTFVVEQIRALLIQGILPDFQPLAIYTGISISVAWAGFWFFQRSRGGFADVV